MKFIVNMLSRSERRKERKRVLEADERANNNNKKVY